MSIRPPIATRDRPALEENRIASRAERALREGQGQTADVLRQFFSTCATSGDPILSAAARTALAALGSAS